MNDDINRAMQRLQDVEDRLKDRKVGSAIFQLRAARAQLVKGLSAETTLAKFRKATLAFIDLRRALERFFPGTGGIVEPKQAPFIAEPHPSCPIRAERVEPSFTSLLPPEMIPLVRLTMGQWHDLRHGRRINLLELDRVPPAWAKYVIAFDGYGDSCLFCVISGGTIQAHKMR